MEKVKFLKKECYDSKNFWKQKLFVIICTRKRVVNTYSYVPICFHFIVNVFDREHVSVYFH